MIILKKALAMLLVTVMAAGLFAGCSGSSDDMGGEDVIKVNDTALTKNYVDASWKATIPSPATTKRRSSTVSLRQN